MATVTYIQEHKQSPSAMRGVINYCCQKQKTFDPASGRVLIGGIHCDGANAFDEFMLTKQVFDKTGGVSFYQYTQSFDSLDTISSAEAHALALEFAKRAWPGYEVLVCTHCDTDNPHSHFVVNSVSWQDGRKLRQNPAHAPPASGAQRRAMPRPRPHGHGTNRAKEAVRNVRAGVPFRGQGRKLEAQTDVRDRRVYETGEVPAGVFRADAPRRVRGALDRGPEIHHLHDAHRDAVQGLPAARRKVSERKHGG